MAATGTTVHAQVDTDGDGVLDGSDNCPLQPGDAFFGGCPDSDGDGLPDQYDQCPDQPGQFIEISFGCPDSDFDGTSTATPPAAEAPEALPPTGAQPTANSGLPWASGVALAMGGLILLAGGALVFRRVPPL